MGSVIRNRTSIVLGLAAAIVTIAGCGAQPAKPSEPAPAAQPSAPVSAAPAVPAAQEGTKSSSATAEPAKKVPAGYRLVKRNGKELYCRSVTTLGSRFAEEMCFTREQIDEIEERTDHAMDDFEQSRKTCSGGSHCGG